VLDIEQSGEVTAAAIADRILEWGYPDVGFSKTTQTLTRQYKPKEGLQIRFHGLGIDDNVTHIYLVSDSITDVEYYIVETKFYALRVANTELEHMLHITKLTTTTLWGNE